MRILIVEDDRELCSALKLQLSAKKHTVHCCHAGSEAIYLAMSGAYDLILLDRMLPELDGLAILKAIRQNHISIPIILTTALSSVDDRIAGLDCGADDYLVKPYAIEELLARIRALSRRPLAFSDQTCLSFLDIQFDMEARILTCNEKEQRLSKQKALLMDFFLRNPGKTLTREQIFLRVWGSESAVEDGNLDTYIYFLRKHLRSLGSCANIATVHGMGYRLEDGNVS